MTTQKWSKPKAILILVGLPAVLWVLFVVLDNTVLNVPRPQNVIREEQVPGESAARSAQIAQDKAAILGTGVMTRIDCATHEIQANGSAWASLPLDTKRSAVNALSGICRSETGFSFLKIIDDHSGATLVELSAFSGMKFY
jgi:hypothetical protein